MSWEYLIWFVVGVLLTLGGITNLVRLAYLSYKMNKKKEEERIAHLLKGGLVRVKGTHTISVRLDPRSERYVINSYDYAKDELAHARKLVRGRCTYELAK